MSHRTISVTETGALMDCEAKHAFAYTGHLTGGDALKRKAPAIRLRHGRAWGAAVAAWHATGLYAAAQIALQDSLNADAVDMRRHGLYVEDEHRDAVAHVHALIDHYVDTAERLPLYARELELRAVLPSRTGRRHSNRYVFHGYVDGLTGDGGLWVVEFKLRDTLSSFEQVAWQRQIRWYAWAAERTLGQRVAGVIVDERRNAIPKPPRVLKSGKPSHAKDQLCTTDAYRAACDEAGEPINDETFDALAARRWQARHVVMLRRDEIKRAERELVSAAHLVAEMDAGIRFPVANPSQFRCPGCAFREVCLRPTDDELIDTHYERVPPKRLRRDEEEPMASHLPIEGAAA